MFQKLLLYRKQKKALLAMSLDTLQKVNAIAASLSDMAETFCGLAKTLTPEDARSFVKALGQAAGETMPAEKEGGGLHE